MNNEERHAPETDQYNLYRDMVETYVRGDKKK